MVREICEKKGILYPKKPVAVLYFNRYCPYKCPYCAIRKDDAKPEGELSAKDWFDILDYLKEEFEISFFLILGNEPLSMGEKLLDILDFMNSRGYLYNFYTSFPETIDKSFMHEVFDVTVSVSGAVDTFFQNGKIPVETLRKSKRVYQALVEAKNRGVRDVFATFTLANYNVDQLSSIVRKLSFEEIFVDVNVLHYKPEGLDYFDFFSEYSKFFVPKRDVVLKKQLEEIIEMIDSPLGKYIQPPKEYFRDIYLYGVEQRHKWIYGMGSISIDSDGSMRVCAYRKFVDYKVTIFDIMRSKEKLEEFVDRKYKEMLFCAGCFWECIWMLDYSEKTGDFRFDLDVVRRVNGDRG